MRTLVVGDEHDIVSKICEIMTRCGYEPKLMDVATFQTAGNFLRHARRDMVVLAMSGDRDRNLEMLRELRNSGSSNVLAIGPADDPKYILSSLREGADEYLDETELDAELERTLFRLKMKRLPQTEQGIVVGVMGASGGSGTSTIAANLAAALASRNGQTALFDLRLTAGDQTLLFDLTPTHTIAELCRNCERMDQTMFHQSLARHSSGVQLLAAPRRLADVGDVTPQGIRRALTIARASFPFVLVDLDRTLTDEQCAALLQVDVLLMMVRLDVTSLHNTRRMLERLDELGVVEERIRVVVNQSGQRRELPARRAQQVFGAMPIHYVPNDPAHVNGSTNRGVPVVVERPRAAISKRIFELAENLGKLRNRSEENPPAPEPAATGTLRSIAASLLA